MHRSMYSLILSNEIVSQIDELAAAQGISRSNYINQVLADHISFVTPEEQMRRIFARLTEQIEQTAASFRVGTQGSGTKLSIFGAVQYKYRPTIRYQVELSRDMGQDLVGRLKVSCRSQSRALLDAMDEFWRFWILLEQREDPAGACAQGFYKIEPGRFVCGILRGCCSDENALGEAVGTYIRVFHTLLQSYFTGLQQGASRAALANALAEQYRAMRGKDA